MLRATNWSLFLLLLAVLASGPARADAPSGGDQEESVEPTALGILPLGTRWVPAGEAVLLVETLTELGREQGLRLTPVGNSTCWRDDACYLREARLAQTSPVLAVEVTKTSSARLYMTFLLIDVSAGTVRRMGRVRSVAGALGPRLLPMMRAYRDALPPPRPVTPPAPPLSEPVPISPQPAAAPPRAPEPAPLPVPEPWYRAITANAFVSIAYTWNFNRPPMDKNIYRIYDFEHNAASVDVAELVVQRSVDDPGDAGFRFDLTAGSAVPRVTAASGLFRDAAGNAGDFDLQQAFVSYLSPLGRGLRFDLGKFVTPAGAEVIEGYDGFNDSYSRSLLFGYALPFTHTGARISYPFHDRFAATVLVTNGWDNVTDANSAKSLGAQLTFLPTSDVTLFATYLAGPELPDNDSTWRHLGDLVASWRPSKSLTFTLNVDYGREADKVWRGAAAYLRLDPSKRFALALRGEYFDDADGVRTGTAQRLWELTLSPAFRPAPGFIVRLEGRYDRSNQRSFADSKGARLDQLTAAMNCIYAF